MVQIRLTAAFVVLSTLLAVSARPITYAAALEHARAAYIERSAAQIHPLEDRQQRGGAGQAQAQPIGQVPPPPPAQDQGNRQPPPPPQARALGRWMSTAERRQNGRPAAQQARPQGQNAPPQNNQAANNQIQNNQAPPPVPAPANNNNAAQGNRQQARPGRLLFVRQRQGGNGQNGQVPPPQNDNQTPPPSPTPTPAPPQAPADNGPAAGAQNNNRPVPRFVEDIEAELW